MVDPSKVDVINTYEQNNLLISALKKIRNFLVPNLYNYISPRIKILSEFFPEKFSEGVFDEFATNRVEIDKYNIEQIMELFEKSLRLQISICKIWDIEPILMTQFNRIELNDKLFLKFSKQFPETSASQITEVYKSFNNIIRKVANDSDIVLIDLDKALPKDSIYLYDIVHLNDNGSSKVYELIYPILLEVLLGLEVKNGCNSFSSEKEIIS